MPFVVTDGVRHYYRLTGAAGRPVVMLSHSLGLDHGMWDPQAVDLERHFQVLRYDLRGHGASDAPAAEYSIELLGRDALALANALGVQTFAFCGLSIGGMIGQWIAAHAGERLTHLVLANTTLAHGRSLGDGSAAADGARRGDGGGHRRGARAVLLAGRRGRRCAGGRVGTPRPARDRSGRLRRLLRGGARSQSDRHCSAASARRRW